MDGVGNILQLTKSCSEPKNGPKIYFFTLFWADFQRVSVTTVSFNNTFKNMHFEARRK